ncbi:hypothetical protein T07_6370 [Trichinella nelsoni]|uniref:Uncharacterized protein n=1 Tax=Trichinella nelsoni TaxID=6336 RepID=A0A0V0RPW4_9BILA|nr:hypothetical protein T07_6370 [Trichinella nelsoni]
MENFSAAENKHVWGDGRGTRCNLEQLLAEAEITTSSTSAGTAVENRLTLGI